MDEVRSPDLESTVDNDGRTVLRSTALKTAELICGRATVAVEKAFVANDILLN